MPRPGAEAYSGGRVGLWSGGSRSRRGLTFRTLRMFTERRFIMRSSDDNSPSSRAVTRVEYVCFVVVRRGTAVALFISIDETPTHRTTPRGVCAMRWKSDRRHGSRRGALSLPMPGVRLPVDRARRETRTRSKKSDRVASVLSRYQSQLAASNANSPRNVPAPMADPTAAAFAMLDPSVFSSSC